ncbi:MAG TPA: DUF6364 family protein, partial [Bacteroidota bacterium]|nr:DUF6364 family protein [Bacteroidota bacterium]
RDIIVAAKHHAKSRKTSLSKLIGNYLESLGGESRLEDGTVRLSVPIRRLKGSIRLKQPIVDDKAMLRKALRKRHL